MLACKHTKPNLFAQEIITFSSGRKSRDIQQRAGCVSGCNITHLIYLHNTVKSVENEIVYSGWIELWVIPMWVYNEGD